MDGVIYSAYSDSTGDILIEKNEAKRIHYSPSPDGNFHVHVRNSSNLANFKLFYLIKKSFREMFLPQGYPSSVSSDYLDYQIWDTVQAFCSAINGTLSTHAIFKGVGVGDSTATALSATITWLLRDGTGMVSRIGFAWWKGYSLDTDCKKWRFFADVINDTAFCIELLVGSVYFKDYSPIILCCSMGMKAIVGVAGGSTRASITQHQAIHNNMGDVSAKDGSQETCVNLIASFVAVAFLTQIESNTLCTWTLFLVMTAFHIFANYKAVKSLKFKTLNTSRLNLLVQYYLRFNEVYYPQRINREENVFLGFGLTDYRMCSRKIYLGCSLADIMAMKKCSTADVLNQLRAQKECYEEQSYFIFCDNKSIYVILCNNAKDKDIIKAYFHALIFGITQHNIIVDLQKQERKLPFSESFRNFLNRCKMSTSLEMSVNEYINSTWDHFLSGLSANGWNTDNHQLLVGDWRIEWNH